MTTKRPADTHGDWVLWRSAYGRELIYVPPALIAGLEADQQQRELDRLAAERAEIETRRKKRDEEAAASTAGVVDEEPAAVIGMHRAHAHEVLVHQVLPNVQVVAQRLRRLQDGLYGDKEQTTRELKVLAAALERGPFRSVVRRPDWRRTLADLAAELPAYRAVVQVIENAMALTEATGATPSVPPILIVGPPGVGKSFFCRRLTQAMESGSAWISMDQHSAGADLRGSDNHWSNTRHGLLFELLGLGDTANPLIVLDEIDKAPRSMGTQDIDMLAQLYSALEPETSRHLADVSLDVELDASLVMYVATANSLKRIDAPLLSRFEVVQVGLPSPAERRESAARVVDSVLGRLGVRGVVKVNGGCIALLAEFSARVVHRSVEKAVGAAVASGRDRVTADDMEIALGLATPQAPQNGRPH